MRYSVWEGKQYSYYEAPGELDDGVFAPPARVRSYSRIGIAPDDAARPLPASARLVGRGPVAQGLIATRNAGPLGFLPIDSGTVKLAVYGIIGWYVWTRVLGSSTKSKIKKAVGV
jgi:hypothetical protein